MVFLLTIFPLRSYLLHFALSDNRHSRYSVDVWVQSQVANALATVFERIDLQVEEFTWKVQDVCRGNVLTAQLYADVGEIAICVRPSTSTVSEAEPPSSAVNFCPC